MKRITQHGLCIAFLVTYASSSHAQTFSAPPPPPQGVVVPNSIAAGNQVYPASVSGVRDLVEAYRAEEPFLYKKLDKKVVELEEMRTRAWIVGVGTALVGIGMVVGGFMLYNPPPPGSSEPPNTTPLLVGVLVGVPLTLLSYPIGAAFGPSREDYMNFVNHHNKIAPDKPIKWQLGALPTPNGVGFKLGLGALF